MKQRCMACGVEKDGSVKEVYPYPEDGLIEDPIDPFMAIDCKGSLVDGLIDWRVAMICHDCFHRLDMDMWISDECWQSMNPVIPFAQLPKQDK